MEENEIKDNAGDRKYFTLTPRIVLAMCDSPFELTLWTVIKDVSGEAGECYLTTNDLAALAMMSAGKVSECRQSLIEKKLLDGELRKDPGYPQPVWHLRVPDLWGKNIEWAKKYPTIKERIEHKNSLHLVKPSPGEEGLTPHEEGLTPHETKKNNKEEEKKNHLREELSEELKSALRDLELTSGDVIDVNKPTPAQLVRARALLALRNNQVREAGRGVSAPRVEGVPERMIEHLQVFAEAAKMGMTGKQKSLWIGTGDEWLELGVTVEAIPRMVALNNERGLSIRGPTSITWAWHELNNPKGPPRQEELTGEELEQKRREVQAIYDERMRQKHG